LLGAAPNPFNPRTLIRFELSRAARVRLTIFDVRGARVRVLVDGSRPSGHHEVAWDGRDGRGMDAATGTYFYRLEAEQVAESKKLTLLR
jgi:flagellar hook assembly protein FlgD